MAKRVKVQWLFHAAGNTGLFEVTTGYSDTQAIIEQTAGKTDSQNITGAPAAEAAWNYKANDYDTMQWYLPSITELRLICEFKTEINAFLTKYFAGGTITGDWYWSSTEYDSSSSWYVYMYGGTSLTNYRNTTNRVRSPDFVTSSCHMMATPILWAFQRFYMVAQGGAR